MADRVALRLKYNKALRLEVLKIFETSEASLTVTNIIPHLEHMGVLTKRDAEVVRAIYDNFGETEAVGKLLDFLCVYEDWFSNLMSVLRHCEVKLENVATLVEERTQDIREQYKCTELPHEVEDYQYTGGVACQPASDSEYNQALKDAVREIFAHYIKTFHVLSFFSKYDCTVLEKKDRDHVKAVTTQKGDTHGALQLLDLFGADTNWFPCLLQVLRDSNVRLQHVAVMMEMVTGFNPLPAAYNGEHEVLKLVISRGANAENINASGDTALSLAASRGHSLCVQVLIDAGVSLNDMRGRSATFSAIKEGYAKCAELMINQMETSCKVTLLLEAASRGETVCLQFFIDRFFDVNAADENGNTPLILAAEFGHPAIIERLINAGAMIDYCDKEGQTAFYKAVVNEQVTCAFLLKERGADPGIPIKEGRVPVVDFAYQGKTEAVELLINLEVDLSMCDLYGDTAVILAVRQGHCNSVELLIDAGIPANCRNYNGETALHLAAMIGHLDCVTLLLHKRADVNITDHSGNTPLILAAGHGHQDCVEALLEAGTQINHRNDDGETAMHLASKHKHRVVVSLLLFNGADVNIVDKWMMTPLMTAAREGEDRFVQLFVECKADVSRADSNGDTALALVAAYGQPRCVDTLIKAGASVNQRNKDGNTALHLAALNGNSNCLKLLLAEGSNINCVDLKLNTPVMKAASRGNTECLKVLLERGASITKPNMDGNTALIQATEGGHLDCVKELTAACSPINHQNKKGQTALISSAMNGYTECVRFLMDKSAKANINDKDGMTALLAAATKGHLSCIRVLIEGNAKLSKVDFDGNTALILAAEQGHLDAVDLLKEAGVNINKKNKRGDNALHLAAANGSLICADAIVSHDSHLVNKRNKCGSTPLHLAAQNGHASIVKLLISSGARVDKRNNARNTPLHLARKNGNTNCIELLQKGAQIKENTNVEESSVNESASLNVE